MRDVRPHQVRGGQVPSQTLSATTVTRLQPGVRQASHLSGGVLTMSNPYDNSAERVSVLGPTLHFKGELHADEELLIKGRIEGSITHSQRVTVCAEGTVTANVRAQMIVVEGTVTGDLQAEKSVMVRDTARFCVNSTPPSVSIVEGAQFNGGIDMEKKVAAVESAGAAASERTQKVSGGSR